MSPRLEIAKVQPEAYAAMRGLERYLRSSSLDPTTWELVKIRASMLNGCAYCIDMHTAEARQQGESERRLYALGAWHDSPFFSPAERAALALTDAVTRLGDGGVPDDVWEEATQHFDQPTLAALVVAIATINAWNRLAVATHLGHNLRLDAAPPVAGRR